MAVALTDGSPRTNPAFQLSPEPLSWMIPLLPRRIQHPFLSFHVRDLGRDPVEPTPGLFLIADSPPQLPYEVRHRRPIFAVDALRDERILESPRREAPEVALRLNVSL